MAQKKDLVSPDDKPDVPPSGWVGLGAGGSYFNVVDKAFSAIPYKGLGWGAAGRAGFKRSGSWQEIQFYYSRGTLEPDVDGNTDMDQEYFSIDYTYQVRLKPKRSNAEFHIGPHLIGSYSERTLSGYLNRNSSFEWAIGAGVTAGAMYTIPLKKGDFRFMNHFSVPFINYIRQPAFGTVRNGEDKQGGFDSWKDFRRFKNRLTIEKILLPKHILSFSYTWDYAHFKTNRELRLANHYVGLGYSIIL